MTPARYLRLHRLNEAHRDLSRADPGLAIVTTGTRNLAGASLVITDLVYTSNKIKIIETGTGYTRLPI